MIKFLRKAISICPAPGLFQRFPDPALRKWGGQGNVHIPVKAIKIPTQSDQAFLPGEVVPVFRVVVIGILLACESSGLAL